jgi:hypothetical protein
MASLIRLVSISMVLHLWSRISYIASGLALLEDEQKFKLGVCVGAHKTPISCTNMLIKCIK